MMDIFLLFYSFVTGALVAGIIGYYAHPLGERLGLLDYPDSDGGRKQHLHVTPLVGGLGVCLAILAGLVLTATDQLLPYQAELLFWLGASVGGMFLIGVVDDRIELSAGFRLGVATLLMLVAMVRVPRFEIDFLLFSGQESLMLLPGVIGTGFTLLCLVGLLNAVNMADGKNGLVIGQALIWSLILLVRLPDWFAPLLAVVIGSLLVLFVFNMRGKLFLGDGGSYCISAFFGLLAVVAWNEGFSEMRADDLALIFALPVFDTLRLMGQRLFYQKSPFTPGRDHLHHYLSDRWGWPAPLLPVLALVALPNAAALLLPGTGMLWLAVTFGGYLVLLYAAVRRPQYTVR